VNQTTMHDEFVNFNSILKVILEVIYE